METGESDPAAASGDSPHGIEVGIEFKPVEHPVEPVNLDQPVKCPLPEPSILHVSLFSCLRKIECLNGGM
jgi:hypothetical protein